MKFTGIVRNIDDLGRIVLPKELRRTLRINHKDPIYVEEDTIIIKKYEPSCLFCGNAGNVVSYLDKRICKDCIAKLGEME